MKNLKLINFTLESLPFTSKDCCSDLEVIAQNSYVMDFTVSQAVPDLHRIRWYTGYHQQVVVL